MQRALRVWSKLHVSVELNNMLSVFSETIQSYSMDLLYIAMANISNKNHPDH